MNDVTMCGRSTNLYFLLFFATFLYENEAPGLEQAVVVTMATRVQSAQLHAKFEGGLKIFIFQVV